MLSKKWSALWERNLLSLRPCLVRRRTMGSSSQASNSRRKVSAVAGAATMAADVAAKAPNKARRDGVGLIEPIMHLLVRIVAGGQVGRASWRVRVGQDV